jgi:hypothetical protein
MKNFICHCNVSANDGVGNISAKPTIFVEAIDNTGALQEAKRQLEEQYHKMGCHSVFITVALLKQI